MIRRLRRKSASARGTYCDSGNEFVNPVVPVNMPPVSLLPWIIVNGTGSALTGLAAYGTFAPTSQFWGRFILRAPSSNRRAISLTFDDGPTDGPTDRILDVLRDTGVKATFFVIGQNCVRSPDLIRRIDADGHIVANHTWDHLHSGWRGMGRFWRDQIERTSDAIASIIGKRPAFFRPPMGHKTWFTLAAARISGCQTIGWTSRARDGVVTTAPEILARLQDSNAGDILLLHDGIEPNSPGRDPVPTVEALPKLIAMLRERGLETARLDELLKMPAYQG